MRPQDAPPDEELPIVSVFKWAKKQLGSDWNMSPSEWGPTDKPSQSPVAKPPKKSLPVTNYPYNIRPAIKTLPPAPTSQVPLSVINTPPAIEAVRYDTHEASTLHDDQVARLLSIAKVKPPKQKRSNKKSFFAWSGVLLVVVCLISSPIANGLTLLNADPQMKQMASTAGMNTNGKLYFLRTHPIIISGTDFTNRCNSQAGEVLEGCYLPNQGSIYIRTMPDQLASEETVTAAHEMLHAAYRDLSDTEKAQVNNMVEAAYSQIHDSKLDSEMAQYAQTEPGARDNELHSILGTEYANLPVDLEQYYSKYFQNRSQVIASNQRTEDTFNTYENDLTSLENKIAQDKNQANTDYSRHVYYANIGNDYYWNYYYNQYSNDINQTNSDINAYNSELDNYKLLVSEYEGKDFSAISPTQTQIQSQ